MTAPNGCPPILEWVREYEAQLLAVARGFETDQVSAEDILQEAWIVAMRKGGSLAPGSRPGAWLYQVVLNIGRGTRRKAERQRRLSLLFGNGATRQPNPPRGIGEELLRRSLWDRIAALPQGQQCVLLLRIVDEYEPTEIAELLETTPGAIRTKLARALRALRAHLVHEDEPEFLVNPGHALVPRGGTV